MTFADVNVEAEFDRVFDQGLTTGMCRLGQGFNRVCRRGFEVMTQVDLGLTSVGRFDSADSVISFNDVN
jgi:hypothetical protein